MGSICQVSGIPSGARLSDIEQIMLQHSTGRILAIGLHNNGCALVEFELEQDANACVGERQLMDAVVIVQRQKEPQEQSSIKRSREEQPVSTSETGDSPSSSSGGGLAAAGAAGTTQGAGASGPALATQSSQDAKKIRAETRREKVCSAALRLSPL